MHVDDFLTTTPLPDVAVDTEGALARTTHRGDRRRAHRRLASLATVAVGVVAAGAFGLLRHDADDEPGQVSTGPDPSTTITPTAPEPGDATTWRIDGDAGRLPSPGATTLDVQVADSCVDARRAQVLRPGVVFSETQVVVTFTVEAADGEGLSACPPRDVPYHVELGQPLGDRVVVDGNCVGYGEFVGYQSVCPIEDGVRWQPPKPPFRTVSGVLQMVGGPAEAGPDPTPGTIVAYDEAGRPVAQVRTDDAGRFTVELPAGRYDLVGRSPNYVDGNWTCDTADTIVVVAQSVDHVTVDCQRY